MKAAMGMVAGRVERDGGCIRCLQVTHMLFEESEVMSPRGWESQ